MHLIKYLTCFFLSFLALLSAPTHESAAATQEPSVATAISTMDSEALSQIITNEMDAALIPAAAASVIGEQALEVICYPSTEVKDDTLFLIGSISKAYTGLGILLLEDKGLLSINDPVAKYLPWFIVNYDGKRVPSTDLTIANLLYQTSGFTNSDAKYPAATADMTLNDSIHRLNGCNLSFYPNTRYEYSNTNYRILGLIIEVVSGSSYADFLREEILLPLGLTNTYASPTAAKETEKIIPGARLSYLKAFQYDIAISEGNVPHGYIYSTITDMSRLAQIQLGEIEISAQFTRIIEKSHQPNPNSIVDNQTHYAAGWFVDDRSGKIYHSGATPNYSSDLILSPENHTAVCVLTNLNASANTIHMAENLMSHITGQSTTPPVRDVWRVFDIIFSIVSLFAIFLLIANTLFLILSSLSRKRLRDYSVYSARGTTKKRIIYYIVPMTMALCVITFLIIFPIICGDSLFRLTIWAPSSIFIGIALLTVATISTFIVARHLSRRRIIFATEPYSSNANLTIIPDIVKDTP